ncbi:substrate-binding domain-containing protein [Homoserinibacter sp. YIM 151385]|uniref:substrate-binding domain-containing protein n=1 Tax=Homoserinibacter sp. YIM 151385 TaxID=2985506 RepID=UPI0022F0071C|nr:sugar-binding protein [Homoserinibacter sp. YIM 151385]WBU36917.1 sugar ABC transporter substrate-binding protein [Homoserinibacter sp. YIM 151385]
MRKIALTTTAVAAVALMALAGCSSRADTETGTEGDGGFAADSLIGVALPDKTSENWVLAGGLFEDAIAEAGFKGEVQYAGQSTPVPDQQAQIDAMVTNGAKVIIIGAKDGGQLGAQVAAARESGAVVIAYDRILENTEDIDYYLAFNNFAVGQAQGQALLDGLEAKGDGPYNVELFAGSPDDPNAAVFFNGALDILQPKIDDGTLNIVSGQTEFEQVVTQGWAPEEAQSRADTLLQANYGSTELDGVLSPNDTLARAVITSVEQAGKPDIVITGQDSEAASIPLIMEGKQYMTIYKDTRRLVAAALDMVKALAAGDEPETNAEENNKTIEVPTFYLDPVTVTAENAAEVYADNPDLEPLTK